MGDPWRRYNWIAKNILFFKDLADVEKLTIFKISL